MGGSACRDSFTRICNLIFPRSLRKGVNVLVWLVAIPHPLREREQSCSSRQAKATNAGVGVTQEHLQSAPLCEGKLFSDTLPLCSRYRFENLSLASLCLNLASAAFPCHPIPECVMLNLFQHLTVLACYLPSCKILNSLKIGSETKAQTYITTNDFLRFQDDNAYTSPRPLRERVQSCSSRKAKATNAGVGLKTIIHEYPPTVSDHFPLKGGRCLRLQSTSFVFPCPLGGSGQIHPTYCVILSPASIQVRRIFKTLQKGDSSGFRPQNDGTLVSLASPRPLGESGFSVGRCRACGSGSVVRKDVNSFPQASKPVRWREAGNFPTPRIIQGGKCIEWLVVSPRPLRERVEFQVERERNLEIRVWG